MCMRGCLLVDIIFHFEQIIGHGLVGELVQNGGHYIKTPVEIYNNRIDDQYKKLQVLHAHELFYNTVHKISIALAKS